jgi:hypothetical protein
MIIGYPRISTTEQNLGLQRDTAGPVLPIAGWCRVAGRSTDVAALTLPIAFSL